MPRSVRQVRSLTIMTSATGQGLCKQEWEDCFRPGSLIRHRDVEKRWRPPKQSKEQTRKSNSERGRGIPFGSWSLLPWMSEPRD
ncbi:hypothetical protein PoB_006941700 [Plakobranchus ocellatus]|uniref:Uncharacterized protein n=1 Tax=Plakobranchus ocellatus TaxID=259542 RepID=A0AAV4DF73_9GAST|nr:hypothetical protein PoB_006941700 [Plakobranchus ocellatus]